MKMATRLAISLILFVSLFWNTNSAFSCTLYAAQGEAVKGGGTLIGKIRDFKPGPQRVRAVYGQGNAYYGLFSFNAKGQQVMKAGINEHGLAAVTAMASCIRKSDRQQMARTPAYLKKVLTECDSVDDVLHRFDLMLGPRFVMLADAKEIACIEIGDYGEYKVFRKKNDVLYHTNHYQSSEFAELNQRIGPSSAARYKRMGELFASKSRPYSMEDFIQFSEDRNDGPDNSIWRVGSTKTVSQTLASFLVDIKPDGNFSLRVKYRPEVKDKGHEVVKVLDRAALRAGKTSS